MKRHLDLRASPPAQTVLFADDTPSDVRALMDEPPPPTGRAPLRLVVWNCAGALHRKFDRLLALAPDVAVVPECATPDILRRKGGALPFDDCDWEGSNPNKGLGVFTFGPWRLRRHASWRREHHVFLPLELRSGARPVNLLATWAFNHRVPPEIAPVPRTTAEIIAHHADFLQGDALPLVAGDFNSNAIWDRPAKRAFADTDAALAALGLSSLYHAVRGERFGEETLPTHWWQRRAIQPYHIDYVYAPTAWARQATLPATASQVWVGPVTEWLAWSDHAPLVITGDLLPDADAARTGR